MIMCMIIGYRIKILLLLALLIPSYSYSSYDPDKYLELIEQKERQYGIPKYLLKAISKQESDHRPWSLSVSSIPMYFNSRDEMINALWHLNNKKYVYKDTNGIISFFSSKLDAMKDAASRGINTKEIKKINIRSTDICGLQINWHWHEKNFRDVIELTDVEVCIDYAAKYLSGFLKKYPLKKAVGCYHNCNVNSPDHHKYSKVIMQKYLKYREKYKDDI